MNKCLCDRHPFRQKNHGGPCCGVAGGKCIVCEPRRLTDFDPGDGWRLDPDATLQALTDLRAEGR